MYAIEWNHNGHWTTDLGDDYREYASIGECEAAINELLAIFPDANYRTTEV